MLVSHAAMLLLWHATFIYHQQLCLSILMIRYVLAHNYDLTSLTPFVHLTASTLLYFRPQYDFMLPLYILRW
jgi:hypothetical protein